MKKFILLIFIISTSFAQQSWIRIFGGTYQDVGYSVQKTSDGGYTVAGYTRSFGAGGYDVYIVKTDSSGDTIWTRTYGGVGEDYGYSIQQTMDGGYIITGYTNSFGVGWDDVYLIKTDSTGDTLWTRTFGGVYWDVAISIQQTTDGGYIVAGYAESFGAIDGDVCLIKTDSNGNAAVEESKIRVQSSGIRLMVVPNPFISLARIPGYEKEDFALADITGRMVGKYKGAKIGENLPAGVYFIIPQNKNINPIRIVKVK